MKKYICEYTLLPGKSKEEKKTKINNLTVTSERLIHIDIILKTLRHQNKNYDFLLI